LSVRQLPALSRRPPASCLRLPNPLIALALEARSPARQSQRALLGDVLPKGPQSALDVTASHYHFRHAINLLSWTGRRGQYRPRLPCRPPYFAARRTSACSTYTRRISARGRAGIPKPTLLSSPEILSGTLLGGFLPAESVLSLLSRVPFRAFCSLPDMSWARPVTGPLRAPIHHGRFAPGIRKSSGEAPYSPLFAPSALAAMGLRPSVRAPGWGYWGAHRGFQMFGSDTGDSRQVSAQRFRGGQDPPGQRRPLLRRRYWAGVSTSTPPILRPYSDPK